MWWAPIWIPWKTARELTTTAAASPNGVRSIHDGDGSDFEEAGPKGSREIEDVLFRFFEDTSLPAETTPSDGDDSDYEPFLRAGIPGGGLFTGDEESKTQAQVQAYGGGDFRIPGTGVAGPARSRKAAARRITCRQSMAAPVRSR